MKSAGRTTKTSFRFITIGIILVLLSGLALASGWANVTSFAESLGAGLFGAAAEKQTAPTDSPVKNFVRDDNLTIGTCDTAGPIEVESTGGTTTPTAYG